MPALAEPDIAPATAVPGRRWADLRTRTLSAVVLAPVALACIWFGGVAWAILMAGAFGALALEWINMCRGTWSGWRRVLVLLAGLALMRLAADRLDLALLGLLVGWAAVWLSSRSAVLAAGLPYIGLPLLCLVWLRDGDGARSATAGQVDVVFLVVVVWASDIGAYMAGRLLGGPKLAPSISPGKTWSGAVGGIVAAMLAGEAAAQALVPGTMGLAALIAGGLGVASQAGDLLESWIKRQFGVKDSGRLIPGHGGLLDRLDGLLAASAAACILLNTGLLGRGGVLWK